MKTIIWVVLTLAIIYIALAIGFVGMTADQAVYSLFDGAAQLAQSTGL